MPDRPVDKTYDEQEAKRCFEATLRAALNTAPKPPLKDVPKKRPRKAVVTPARRAENPPSGHASVSSPRGRRGQP